MPPTKHSDQQSKQPPSRKAQPHKAAKPSKVPKRVTNYSFSDLSQASFSEDQHKLVFKCCIHGIPRPLYRACISRSGQPHYYNPIPADKASFVDAIKQAIQACDVPVHWLDHHQNPIAIWTKFHFPRPKVHYSANPLTGALVLPSHPLPPFYVTKTPDVDNCLKLVMDSLTHVLYKDDCSVADITSKQVWWAPHPTHYTVDQDQHGYTLLKVTQYKHSTTQAGCTCEICHGTKTLRHHTPTKTPTK